MRSSDGQRGQSAVEYLGVLLLVSVIIAAIVGSGLGSQISRGLERQVCQISGQENCEQADAGTAARPPGPPDADRDGLSDKQEKRLGTKANVADSDGDRIPDGQEVERYKTDPALRDSDGDGLTDAEEIRSGGRLDPTSADKDADGLNDAEEIAAGTRPNDGDTDGEGGAFGDGLTDLEEIRLGTDPTRADSDSDGTWDGKEVDEGSNPARDERNFLQKAGTFILDNPIDFLIPTGATRSTAVKSVEGAVKKFAPKLAGLRKAKDLKALAALRRARVSAAGRLRAKLGRTKFVINDAQFGKKARKHAMDFGLDPSAAADRARLRSIIEEIGTKPNRVVKGTFRGQGIDGARGPVRFYVKGSDVVVTTPTGEYVTVLKDGAVANASVREALGRVP